MTTEEATDRAVADELRQRATLSEYEFTADTPGEGWLPAWLRAAWNSMATKWQARPVMTQQSAFNHALADWLAQSLGEADVEARLFDIYRQVTQLDAVVGRPEAGARRLRRRAADPVGGDRLRIAYFSPMPPSRSGIADYSAALLPFLAELADVTIFTDSTAAAPLAGIPMMSTDRFSSISDKFDLPLYQMGNSDQHEAIYDLLISHPGVVVLHDFFIHHFMHHHTAGQGHWTDYESEIIYALGSFREGRRLSDAVREGQAAVPLFDIPLNRRLIDTSLGLVVHSHYTAGRARQSRPDLPLLIAPPLIEIRDGHSRRAELGLPDDAVIFGSFGQITAEKQIELALRALADVRARHPQSHYLLVGEPQPDVDLAALLAQIDEANFVHPIGFVDTLDTFVDWIHTADVVVNLRLPTVGETSAVALRAMAAARPLIVFDHGWYSELPAGAAIKVPPGDVAALREAMARLAAAPELRRAMGAAGLRIVQDHCQPAHVARAIIDFLHNVLEPRGQLHG